MPDLADVVAFIRAEAAIPACIEISGKTRLEADLGIVGDDGVDLLRAAESRYGVSFGADWRPLFQLGPGEVLFSSEGLGIPGISWLLDRLGLAPRAAVTDLTVDQLHTAIHRCSADSSPPGSAT